MHLISHVTMTDTLPNFEPAPSNPLLDINLNMNLNSKTTAHDNMNNVKYQESDTLHEPVLFKTVRQIRISHGMFKIPSFLISGLF